MSDESRPSPRDARIGVYVCHCGGNISGTVQCDRVAAAMGRLPGVTVARTDESLCSDAGQSRLEQDIRELGVNRVVVGACAPALHEETFRGAVARAGLNPYLYHHVGLREQDSWVHSRDKEAATDKAVRLMAAGVAKARLLEPLDPIRLGAEKQALVVGGGVAGLRAALDIARNGLRVLLVEKSPHLGGRVADLDAVFANEEQAHVLLRELIDAVRAHPNVTVFTRARVAAVSGYVGNFTAHIEHRARGTGGAIPTKAGPRQSPEGPDDDTEGDVRIDVIAAGAVVVATGFDPYEPPHGELGYGELPQVVTLPRLIRHLADLEAGRALEWEGRTVRDVALIHCVGSRQIEGVHAPQADGQVNSYCSRVCCTASLHALEQLHRRDPGLDLYDLHQDVRTYGRGHEDYYRSTLDAGVRFLRYHGEEPPVVTAAPEGDSRPVLVRVKDALTCGREIEIAVDLVVLAVGMMPRPVDDLVRMLKISRGSDRFLLEVHPKLRPVETAVNGVVLAGTAQGPMNIQESLSAGSAAAAKVAALLGRGGVELPPFVARVDATRCHGTGACVAACAYEGALTLQAFDEGGRRLERVVVTPAHCVGCGACVSACPNGAIDVQGWTLAQYESMVAAIGAETPVPVEAGP
jgi:heterodisulfide reductase subunit A